MFVYYKLARPIESLTVLSDVDQVEEWLELHHHRLHRILLVGHRVGDLVKLVHLARWIPHHLRLVLLLHLHVLRDSLRNLLLLLLYEVCLSVHKVHEWHWLLEHIYVDCILSVLIDDGTRKLNTPLLDELLVR